MKIESDSFDISLPARQNAVNRVDQWLGETSSGETDLGYDDWLEEHLTERVTDGLQSPIAHFRQGKVEFSLRHGAEYLITHATLGFRIFRCLLDKDLALVAFIDSRSGMRFPWITMNQLFSSDELSTLKEVPRGIAD
ncbi:hypothetical protein CF70_004240 [Cupriavidus sp. SK-3]|nr:hypothetical protein CF70_004240 [Cupriavidus sp. SK-3]